MIFIPVPDHLFQVIRGSAGPDILKKGQITKDSVADADPGINAF
jgi:hypothetical protein